jgi:hypothetical protein
MRGSSQRRMQRSRQEKLKAKLDQGNIPDPLHLQPASPLQSFPRDLLVVQRAFRVADISEAFLMIDACREFLSRSPKL